MPSLLETKKKINGVKNTRKITKAMQLVATAKMKVFQRKATSTRDYTWDLLNALHQNLNEDMKNIYAEKRTEGKTLFVLYSSDKGLCGPLNNHLMKVLFRSEKWLKLRPEERLLLTIGKKAKEFAKSNKIKVEHEFAGLTEDPTLLTVLPIIDKILSYWHNGECKEIIFVAPHYKNTFTFYPVLKIFLPFSFEMIKSNVGHKDDAFAPKLKVDDYMYYEPNKQRVIDVLFLQIIQSLFVQSFFELKASEYSSRMIAMKNATDSANNIISDLTRVYNKTRQQMITQQIAELIGASEAFTN